MDLFGRKEISYLKAEVSRLTAENKRLTNQNQDLRGEISLALGDELRFQVRMSKRILPQHDELGALRLVLDYVRGELARHEFAQERKAMMK